MIRLGKKIWKIFSGKENDRKFLTSFPAGHVHAIIVLFLCCLGASRKAWLEALSALGESAFIRPILLLAAELQYQFGGFAPKGLHRTKSDFSLFLAYSPILILIKRIMCCDQPLIYSFNFAITLTFSFFFLHSKIKFIL